MIFENPKISDHSDFFLLYNTLKSEQKMFLGKKKIVSEKKIVSLEKTLKIFFVSGIHGGRFQFIVILIPYLGGLLSPCGSHWLR